MTNTSIIIPVIYRADLMRVCLDSVLNYTNDCEIIVVHEGTDEDVTRLLYDYKSKVKIVQNKEPKGYPGAINTGLKHIDSSAEYVVFLNSDVVCTPEWFDKMEEALQHKEVGMVGPLYNEVLDFQGHLNAQRKGDNIAYVDMLKGVCLCFRRKVLDDLYDKRDAHNVQGEGVLDERFGLGGGDDNDIAHRVKELGYKVAIVRDSFIYHYGSASFQELFEGDAEESKKYSASVFYKFKRKWRINDKPSVMIALPMVDGKIHHELMTRIIEWTHDPEIQIKICVVPHLVPLDNARNKGVAMFLKDYCDYLMFIDNDIVPPANALREMIKADKDIIAATCFITKTDDKGLPAPLPMAMKYNEDQEYEPYYGNSIEEVDIVTSAMILIKREVVENMGRMYEFEYNELGELVHSEDFIFCRKAQAKGYKLYNHFGLTCKHFKGIDLKDMNDLLVNVSKIKSNE